MGTNTVKDLKQRYIDHLMSMDLGRLDVMSLHQLAMIIRNLEEMDKPGYAEALGMAMGAFDRCCVTTKEG